MITLTFVRAANGTPIVKHITDTSSSSYPMVRNMTSHEQTLQEEENWVEDMTILLREEAASGAALLKGGLLRPIMDESRAGLADKTAPTRLIVIDIDGLCLPGWNNPSTISEEELTHAANNIIALLPKFLHNASFIVNASASLGIKPGINLHIFMVLDEEVEPRTLKDFLTALNFHTPSIKRQTKLTASGLALSFPVDRTLADNSRVIYIGTPVFRDVDDPVPERFAYREKDDPFVETEELTKYMRRIKTSRLVQERVAEARSDADLPPKDAHKFHINDGDGRRQHVLANPDNVQLVRVNEDERFMRFNLGDGDSAAYWIHKHDPRIVHNFKNEDPFLYEQADPDGYKALLDYLNVSPPADIIKMPFADVQSNKLRIAPVNTNTWRLEGPAYPVSSEILSHTIRSHGQEVPDPIPEMEFIFDPHDPKGVDLANHRLNVYCPPPMLLKETPLDERYHQCPYELTSKVLPLLCPTIHKTLYSITGCSLDDYHHLVNWLAYIMQYQDKTGTAWLFHGAEGTGKGALYEYVLKPILTPEYTQLITQTNLRDKFTGWTENKLLIACDEVSFSNRSRDKEQLQNLKNFITETETSIRIMHAGIKRIRSYTNWIFFTNDRDSLPISDKDRRFNIATRQEYSLIERYPEFRKGDVYVQDLLREAPLFATFLNNMEIDDIAAKRPLESEAKAEMVLATQTPIATICRLITHGDIAPFLPILEVAPDANNIALIQAQHILRSSILHLIPSPGKKDARCYKDWTAVSQDMLFTLYRAMTDSHMTGAKFGQELKKMGMLSKKSSVCFRPTQPERHTLGSQSGRRFKICWRAYNDSVVDDLLGLQRGIVHEIRGANHGDMPDWMEILHTRGGHLEFDYDEKNSDNGDGPED